MSVRLTLALAAVAASVAPLAPATAADLAPPLFANCAPPPAALATVAPAPGFRGWKARIEQPHIEDVQRYDPHNPPANVVPTYVPPQVAYLATPLCDFPNGVSDRSWYDGQLFYKQGGSKAAPDTFMVIERK